MTLRVSMRIHQSPRSRTSVHSLAARAESGSLSTIVNVSPALYSAIRSPSARRPGLPQSSRTTSSVLPVATSRRTTRPFVGPERGSNASGGAISGSSNGGRSASSSRSDVAETNGDERVRTVDGERQPHFWKPEDLQRLLERGGGEREREPVLAPLIRRELAAVFRGPQGHQASASSPVVCRKRIPQGPMRPLRGHESPSRSRRTAFVYPSAQPPTAKTGHSMAGSPRRPSHASSGRRGDWCSGAVGARPRRTPRVCLQDADRAASASRDDQGPAHALYPSARTTSAASAASPAGSTATELVKEGLHETVPGLPDRAAAG
jgi:hypothetical protein